MCISAINCFTMQSIRLYQTHAVVFISSTTQQLIKTKRLLSNAQRLILSTSESYYMLGILNAHAVIQDYSYNYIIICDGSINMTDIFFYLDQIYAYV